MAIDPNSPELLTAVPSDVQAATIVDALAERGKCLVAGRAGRASRFFDGYHGTSRVSIALSGVHLIMQRDGSPARFPQFPCT